MIQEKPGYALVTMTSQNLEKRDQLIESICAKRRPDHLMGKSLEETFWSLTTDRRNKYTVEYLRKTMKNAKRIVPLKSKKSNKNVLCKLAYQQLFQLIETLKAAKHLNTLSRQI